MNNTVANKPICLNLNASWQPVGFKTVKDAIIDLCGSESDGKPTSLAIDITYPVKDNGDSDFSATPNMVPVTWSEWVNLPIRSWDLTISSPHKTIRVPTVIIAVNYTKMPVKHFKGKPSKDAIYMRDGGTDQYTGQKLDRHNATVDHVIPRSRGGKDTWENLVLCSKEVNSKKGNKLNSEVGLKLMRQPVAPKPVPVMYLIKDIKHPDWEYFLVK